jgi:DNA-binding LacI/PurR family transcriptional regulator
MGVTSADVARESGVSRTTVSYVLNGTPGATISNATRRRVIETATRLGYAPSAAARTLRSGRSDLVLCVLPDWPIGPVIDTLLEHLADELAERGLSVLVHHGRGTRPLSDLWRAVQPRTVVGFTAFAEEDLRAMRQAGIQVVGTRMDGDDDDPTVVAVSQVQIGELQAQHLVAGGRSRIGWAGSTDERIAQFAQLRLEGVRSGCEQAGLAPPVVLELELTVASAARAVAAWREAGVDAVAAYNDEVGLAVLAGLRAQGLAVPQDVAVIGVDDVPAAALAEPPLSSVDQAIERQAAYLAACTLAVLDGADPPSRPDDLHTVVARESSAPRG